MKKMLTSFLVISSIVLSPALRAEDVGSDQEEPPAGQEVTPVEQEGTPVGQAAADGSNTAKKKQWRNIALAVGAVAVAVTALILIANNDGHHSKEE